MRTILLLYSANVDAYRVRLALNKAGLFRCLETSLGHSFFLKTEQTPTQIGSSLRQLLKSKKTRFFLVEIDESAEGLLEQEVWSFLQMALENS